MITLSVKAKEAIKLGLAMAFAYGIALKLGWMSPSWAGFAIAMTSLATVGQSLHKGVQRLTGTIPGCIAALVIMGLAPQERWEFAMLVGIWVFFTTYMMQGKKNNYFWQVAGFTCLIITLTGPESPQNTFQHAMFRTVETAMGVVVYTLVSVFLWPRTNAGALQKTSSEWLATQTKLFESYRDRLLGGGALEQAAALRSQQASLSVQFTQALQAEGSESYEIKEVRHLWERFQALSVTLGESLERWHESLADVRQLDVHQSLPDFEAYLSEINRRLVQVKGMLDGQAPEGTPQSITLQVNSVALRALPHFDRAALAVTRKELQTLEALTESLFDCVQDLMGFGVRIASRPHKMDTIFPKRSVFTLPLPDRDRLMVATFVVACVWVGFLLWIYVNPPGHASWYMLAGTVAMGVAGMPQIRFTVMAKALALMLPLGIAVYTLIMPQLSGFAELSLLIFAYFFLANYLFTGLPALGANLGFLVMISIQNEQTYNVAASLNSYLFMVGGFLLVFAMSYMIRSPRPEKAVLNMMGRFFRSSEYLLSHALSKTECRPTLVARWRTAYHRQEMSSLPGKIGAWGKFINPELFPNNTSEQVQGLATSLQTLVYRIEMLLETRTELQSDRLVRELQDDIKAWRVALAQMFKRWSADPGDGTTQRLRKKLDELLAQLEDRFTEALNRVSEDELSAVDYENTYRLLGSYRGLSEATVAYTAVAGDIDWAQWREERFS